MKNEKEDRKRGKKRKQVSVSRYRKSNQNSHRQQDSNVGCYSYKEEIGARKEDSGCSKLLESVIERTNRE
jgi:hypothetical protein